MSTALLEREPAWAEVTAGEEPGDHPARDLDSCYAWAIAAITGTEVTDPGMGMEWRLMPIGGTSNPEKSAAAKRPDRPLPPPPADPSRMVRWGETVITAELSHALQRVASGYKYVPPEAAIVSLDQVAAMSDDELLAIDRVGPGMIGVLREAIAELRPDQRGIAVVREAFGVLVHGLDKVDREDPMYESLARALRPLTDALAETVA